MPRLNSLSRSHVVLPALASLLLALAPGTAAGAVPPYTLEERAAAIASPALIYVETQYTGYLRRKDTGEALHPSTIVVTQRCSGAVLSEQGYAVTSKHCVQRGNDLLRESAGHILVNAMVKDGRLAADQRDTFIKGLAGVVDFTGSKAGTAPLVKIFGQLFQGRSGLTSEPATQGEVVRTGTPSGDLALVKFAQSGMPVVEISTGQLAANASVVMVGFGTTDKTSPVTLVARSKTVKITGQFGNANPPIYQIDGDLGADSLGGMVVDADGRLIGAINTDPPGRGPNRMATNSAYITKALSDAGVVNALAPTDQVYREGLNAYFGGHYTESVKKLGNVLALMPDHAIATTYREHATSRLAVEGDVGEGSPSKMLIALIVALGVVLLLCLGAFAMLWRRSRAQARLLRQQAPLMLEAYDPVSAVPLSSQPIATQIWAPHQLSIPEPDPFLDNDDQDNARGFGGFPGDPGR